ncbi:MAG: DUF3179 domain-containing protein [Chloroflexota bacterium]
MNRLQKYSDTIFIGSIITALIGGAVVFTMQWQSIRNGWDNTDFEETTVDLGALSSSGYGRDEFITPIDDPLFTDVMMARSVVVDTAPVIAVNHFDTVRAYPLTIMMVHEIVNDVIDGTSVAITFCPLCNSAIVYERQLEGDVLRMGVSGNLYGNNFLMYDHMTESWWSQLTGEALVGEYAGEMLPILPSQVVSFATFAERYPEGDVLIGDAMRPNVNYDLNPYLGIDESASPLLVQDDYDPRLPPMTRILGANIHNTTIAYAFDTLSNERVVNDVLGETAIVVFWKPGVFTAVSYNTRRATNDIGQAALYGRTVDGRTLTFIHDGSRVVDEQTGSEWNIFGEAIAGELIGTQLPEYTFFSHFWFAWASANPDTLLYVP